MKNKLFSLFLVAALPLSTMFIACNDSDDDKDKTVDLAPTIVGNYDTDVAVSSDDYDFSEYTDLTAKVNIATTVKNEVNLAITNFQFPVPEVGVVNLSLNLNGIPVDGEVGKVNIKTKGFDDYTVMAGFSADIKVSGSVVGDVLTLNVSLDLEDYDMTVNVVLKTPGTEAVEALVGEYIVIPVAIDSDNQNFVDTFMAALEIGYEEDTDSDGVTHQYPHEGTLVISSSANNLYDIELTDFVWPAQVSKGVFDIAYEGVKMSYNAASGVVTIAEKTNKEVTYGNAYFEEVTISGDAVDGVLTIDLYFEGLYTDLGFMKAPWADNEYFNITLQAKL